IFNVEAACASGSIALHGAWKDILSGNSEAALAIGVEKTFFPKHGAKIIEMFAGGADTACLQDLFDKYKKVSAECGKQFAPTAGASLFMDTYATMAAYHMKKYGTTIEQFAAVASKNHFHGSLNPLAQYQFEVPIEKVLSDYMVSWPLTRAMCSPIGDGAAAAIICSAEFLRKLPKSVKHKAVKIMASIPASGYDGDIEDHPTVSNLAAKKAYKMAGITPGDVCVAEVHDATAYAEINQIEQLGFCPFGNGGKYSESGATRYDGEKPVNTSGGCSTTRRGR
ncbi:MAG: thiolase family protein, partial [Nitrospirae bacterium]|nr:thiolase family protein [Nitrospirota bacterium]